MYNVCPNCGIYNAEKTIDPAGPYAICPECDHPHPFLQLPLFVLTGASGAGKTAVCLELVNRLPECVVMESDILWRDEFNQPGTDFREYREMWLRVAKNISQNGRPVLLCGTAAPDGFEHCIERRYFSTIHYLGLVCNNDRLRGRLAARPAWRESYDPAWITSMIAFNNWLVDSAHKTVPPITLLDTTDQPLSDTASAVMDWVRKGL